MYDRPKGEEQLANDRGQLQTYPRKHYGCNKRPPSLLRGATDLFGTGGQARAFVSLCVSSSVLHFLRSRGLGFAEKSLSSFTFYLFFVVAWLMVVCEADENDGMRATVEVL